MWDIIRERLTNGDIAGARLLIDREKARLEAYDDIFACLDAGVCEAEQDRKGMFDAVAKGLRHNPQNYELYYMLGRFYFHSQPDQAFLCLQNALYYCQCPEDADIIRSEMESLVQSYDITVNDVAIIIPTYNADYLLQKNIESIRDTLPADSYKIIVVDNASQDGTVGWLAEQEDIMVVLNEENRGFSCACNQGAAATAGTQAEESDIFLLNNDTRLSLNSLFWLRMGLYGDQSIGAVGSCSNYAGNEQQIEVTFSLPGEYLEYGAERNVPLVRSCEERVRLSGFAMLVKRRVWNDVGGMDEAFTPGYFEDDDLCMRIQQRGFRLLYCKNSFIYHVGSQSFSREESVNDLLLQHHEMFIRKYAFDILEHASPNRILPLQIPYPEDYEFNILQIECGLGADLKLLRSIYPNSHAIGIEQRLALRRIAGCTEAVFESVSQLREVSGGPVFDVLVISPEAAGRLSDKDKELLARMCKREHKIISGRSPYEEVPFGEIKLIVWDLDDTFWKGTLSEENVTLIQSNIQLVKAAADRGIINSISSKNDFAEVSAFLERFQMHSYFVFNDINWADKGEQIRQKLADMGLRAENTLFIDDNPRNLQEVKFINPGIMAYPPDIIPYFMAYLSELPASDKKHERLKRYRLLEKKKSVQRQYARKEEFLFDSQIVVRIEYDCMKELDRIAEMVQRTNQLNFTKKRSGREELLRTISNDWIDCGYIRVRDKFGDYGIVGFYSFNRQEQRLEHFLFSCRIMGMDVEQYIYHRLGSPAIDMIEPVAGELVKGRNVPWIAEESGGGMPEEASFGDNRIRVLLKGPCDMSVIESYLSGGKITTEFNYINPEGFITAGQNHSMHIRQSLECMEGEIEDIVAEVPFVTHGDFETMIFKREYHVICYSLLTDCHAGLYRNKKTGRYISFGSVNFDLTDERNMHGYIDGSIVGHGFTFDEKIIRDFSGRWEFVGTTSCEDIVRNLEYIYDHLPGSPKFVLLLGSEIEYEGENEEFADHAKRHSQVNRAVEAFAEGRERVKLINVTDHIRSQEDFVDCIDHYSRRIYYDLATAVCSCINKYAGREEN